MLFGNGIIMEFFEIGFECVDIQDAVVTGELRKLDIQFCFDNIS